MGDLCRSQRVIVAKCIYLGPSVFRVDAYGHPVSEFPHVEQEKKDKSLQGWLNVFPASTHER